MRPCAVWVLALVAGSLAGCLGSSQTRSTSLLDRARGACGPTGPDVVQLDVAVLEVLLGGLGRRRFRPTAVTPGAAVHANRWVIAATDGPSG